MTRPHRPPSRKTSEPGSAPELGVECFMLADAAQVSDGKLHILGGGLTRLIAPTFPFIYFLTLPALLRIPWSFSEVGHKVSVSGVDEHGESIIPPNETMIPAGQRPPEAVKGDDLKLIASIVIGPAVFPREGVYKFSLMVDGAEVAITQARVVKQPESAAAPAVSPPS